MQVVKYQNDIMRKIIEKKNILNNLMNNASIINNRQQNGNAFDFPYAIQMPMPTSKKSFLFINDFAIR